MPKQNLNSDALQAATDKLWEHHVTYEGLDIGYDEAAELVVSTYFAALPPQPDTVRSTKEVESLPVGTVLREREGSVLELRDINSPFPARWYGLGGDEEGLMAVEIKLPARVLDRPVN
ncbi:hypothetical protein [Glutamicibacter sp.]|uniref:hypothetical protein n=1 Tax=Glutamicibacter sp. TaxID=1931995 RepID=UPI0028BD15F0|nr:hypothetical protein [Glutamicibacter sp.]